MQLDVLVRVVPILGTITTTKTTNLWDFWYSQCSVLLWFHLLKSRLSPVSCLPWRCHPFSASEVVEGLMAGWSAWGRGQVVLSKLSCRVGGKTIRGVYWSWKWKRELAGRVLYPRGTLSLTGTSCCCSTVRRSPTEKGFASLQGEIPCPVREEFPQAAVTFICYRISLPFSNNNGHHSLFWGAKVRGPRSISELYQ